VSLAHVLAPAQVVKIDDLRLRSATKPTRRQLLPLPQPRRGGALGRSVAQPVIAADWLTMLVAEVERRLRGGETEVMMR